MVSRVLTAIDRYVMAPAPAARLGAVRVLVGGFAMIYLWARLPNLISYGGFDPIQFRPVGLVALALDQPLSATVVTATAVVTAVLSIPFFLGWRFRVIGPLFAAALMWTLTYRHSWGMVFHTDNLMALHVLILALSRSADGWSLDARRRAASAAEPAEHGRYGWPLRVMCWVVVIAYLLAGLAKVRNSGLGWVWGDVLRNYIAIDNARKILLGDIYSPLAAPLMSWAWTIKGLALFTVVVELAAPLALLRVRLAALWVALVIGFHLGVLVLMMIVFPYQMVGVAFACFFPSERLLGWAVTRLRRLIGRSA